MISPKRLQTDTIGIQLTRFGLTPIWASGISSSGAGIGQKIGLCNASYYIGEWYLLNGPAENAIERFKFVADNCGSLGPDVKVFPSALAELSRLQQTQQASSVASTTTVDVHSPTSASAAIARIDDKNVSSDDRRIALVIGNSKYQKVPTLANPARDAILVARILKQIGFQDVVAVNDLNKGEMINTLREFASKAENADWAVVYYAGHGMEVAGINYLVPVDATIAVDRDVSFEAVPLDQVMNATERAKKLHLVILDACRDNPFKSQMRRSLAVASRSVAGGLAPVEPDAGTLVVYAAKDGETASDGDGEHSPFAVAFAKNVVLPGLEVRRLFDSVRDDVIDMTHRQQKPFSYGSISGRQNFYFVAAQ